MLDIATGHPTLSVNSVVAQLAWFPPHTFTESHDTTEGGAFHVAYGRRPTAKSRGRMISLGCRSKEAPVIASQLGPEVVVAVLRALQICCGRHSPRIHCRVKTR